MITKTLKIFGHSVGDDSVGIGSIDFEIDLGLYPEDVDSEVREWVERTIIRDIWELHDNGDLRWEFSDEWEKNKDQFEFRRKMTWELSSKILKEMKNEK